MLSRESEMHRRYPNPNTLLHFWIFGFALLIVLRERLIALACDNVGSEGAGRFSYSWFYVLSRKLHVARRSDGPCLILRSSCE
jgi:hypothetical protein